MSLARILVVEDDLTVAEVVVDYLRHAGLDPRHAVDGHIALEMAATWRPDMVILDLTLPGVSGLGGMPALARGTVLDLTVREFDLLAFLVSHPGRAFTRAELLEHVWGWSVGDLSTITVYVRRLRDKVEREPASPAQLQTVWGVGYRWEANPA
jgi:DNA-binding response OmpR family regulator